MQLAVAELHSGKLGVEADEEATDQLRQFGEGEDGSRRPLAELAFCRFKLLRERVGLDQEAAQVLARLISAMPASGPRI